MKKIKFIVAILLLLASQAGTCCTIVSCSRNGKVFFASNEDDYTSTLYPRIWFNPRTADRFGTICFGLGDTQAQAIINEYGLCVDFTAQHTIDPAKFNIKHPYQGDLFFLMLGKCKTVREALAFLQTHEFAGYSQASIADAQGNSVIVNAGAKVMETGSCQINTNFDITDLSKGISDRRYDLAKQMLSTEKDVSFSTMKELLDRSHQEGDLTTIYSYIVDPQRGLIYVYLFHNFDQPYIINIRKALQKGYRLDYLSDHFPPSYAYETELSQYPSKKENILADIRRKGMDATLEHYLPLLDHPAGKDSTLSSDLLEVALQLVKNSMNQYNRGGMWEYWFALPGGYHIVHFRDERLDGADRIFIAIKPRIKDVKLNNFVTELQAYLAMLRGDDATAKSMNEAACAKQQDAYSVTYNRSKAMLAKLNP